MKTLQRRRDRGIALLFCLFALLILSAVTASLILLSGSETSVNGNYRSEEVAFFAAKSGIYEALDRMQQSNSTSIACNIPTGLPGATQPIATGCASAPSGVLYILNAATGQTVAPWSSSNAYVDTELCHEGYTLTGLTSVAPDVPCTSVPSATGWYSTVNSNYPWSGTSVAMPYEWVRINWKQNNSVSYLSGGTTPTTANYAVNGSSSTAVCWNGGSEVLLNPPTGATAPFRCEQYLTCGTVSPTITTPVLLITSLAVTANGSRQLVQAEAALTPPAITVPACGITDPYGFFAYGGTCSSPGLIIGGNASVDGYNSSVGPYSTSHQASLGDVGTNGGAIEQGTSSSIGGNVYVPNVGSSNPPVPNQGCPGDDFTLTGNGTYGHLVQSQLIAVPTVTIPANTSTTNTASSGTIVPGNYRNLSVGNGNTLTLTAPGTYNIQCISAGSNATIVTSPASGKITINISGNSGCASNPLSLGSHATIQNASQIAANIQINYPGTGTLTLTGGPQMYAVVNAPNAAVQLNGGADFYGTIMASTIDDHGGTNLHFDAADTTISGQSASVATATATGSYNILAFHSMPY